MSSPAKERVRTKKQWAAWMSKPWEVAGEVSGQQQKSSQTCVLPGQWILLLRMKQQQPRRCISFQRSCGNKALLSIWYKLCLCNTVVRSRPQAERHYKMLWVILMLWKPMLSRERTAERVYLCWGSTVWSTTQAYTTRISRQVHMCGEFHNACVSAFTPCL